MKLGMNDLRSCEKCGAVYDVKVVNNTKECPSCKNVTWG